MLDVGCGTGYGLAYLVTLGAHGVGIDLSRQAIRYAQKRYRHEGLVFRRMNAEALEFSDGSFDFVISTENFEHLSNQGANLHHMARVLKDEGMLLLATPNHEMFLETCNPYHTRELLYDELLPMLVEHFSDCVIAENLLEPATDQGRRMKAERVRRGAFGINLRSTETLWGRPIDTTFVSNTHSFICLCRRPIRQ